MSLCELDPSLARVMNLNLDLREAERMRAKQGPDLGRTVVDAEGLEPPTSSL